MGPRYSCDAVAAGGPAGRRAGAATLARGHATVYRQSGGAAERTATPRPLRVQSRKLGHFVARRGASAAPAAKRSRGRPRGRGGRALRPRRRPARKTDQRWGGAQAPPHRSLVRLTGPRRAAAPYVASAAGGTSPPRTPRKALRPDGA